MNFIEKIKQILNRKKVKELPAGEQIKYNDRENYIGSLNITQIPNQEIVRNHYLEQSIEMLFNEYNQLVREMYTTGKKPTFYSALTRINSLGGNKEANEIKENQLIDEINNSKRYSLIWQKDKNNVPAFYHVKTKDFQWPKDNNVVRLYINCRDENIAAITELLLAYNNSPQFYLKADATAKLGQIKRSDKIVIYAREEELNYNMQLINFIKNKRPDLFVNSEKINPFMQSIDGIAYAEEPKTNEFKVLDGRKKIVAKSGNEFISQVIEESYMQAARQIAQKDVNLRFLLAKANQNDQLLYAQNYQYINAHYHAQLINTIEKNMKQLCELNKIDIPGINAKIPSEREDLKDR